MAALSRSNPYLSTPAKRAQAVRVTIASSSAIEGIRAPFKAVQPVSRKAALKAASRAKSA